MSAPNPYASAEWWSVTDGSEAVARSITAALQVIDAYRSEHKIYLQTCARLYGDLAPSIHFGNTGDITGQAGMHPGRLTLNITQSCIDTINARVASRIHPMILWLSSGGTYRSQRRAKKLTRFSEGLFREQNTRTLMPRAFKDAEIFGSGWVQAALRHGRLAYERFLEEELHWDRIEAKYGMPRQLHRCRPIDRARLYQLFPSKTALLNRSEIEPLEKEDTEHRKSLSPLVVVRESWRLPDGPKAPGKHVISIPQGVLFSEDWNHEFYPIVKIDYNERPVGWTGQGLAEILCGTQVAINRHLQSVSQTLWAGGTLKIALAEGSRVNPAHITNGLVSMFWYRPTAGGGGVPVYLTPPLVQPEIYQEIVRLEQKGFQLSGISQTSAAGLKQPGVNAAVAMREMVDIENDRFSTISNQYEKAHVDLARISIELVADEVKKGNGTSYTVKDLGSRTQPICDFKDVDFDSDIFTVAAFPIASLPHDPEGRLQAIQERVQAGWLDARYAPRLMDYPDLNSFDNLQNASREYLEFVLDQMIEAHKYTVPDKQEDNLTDALELVTQEVTLAKLGKLEEEDPAAMANLRRFRDAVQDLLDEVQQEQQAQAQAMQPPPASAPQGRAPQPPVSELRPFAGPQAA